jgi:hypothetical protein
MCKISYKCVKFLTNMCKISYKCVKFLTNLWKMNPTKVLLIFVSIIYPILQVIFKKLPQNYREKTFRAKLYRL